MFHSFEVPLPLVNDCAVIDARANARCNKNGMEREISTRNRLVKVSSLKEI
jgi:hypothetical protein